MKTIMIVEDEEILREIFRDELLEAGYEVFLAQTGADCLEQIKKLTSLDLVIMDIKLPDMSGLQLLEKLKAINFSTPVILCTAYDSFQNDFQVWSSSTQVKDYIVKPIDLEQLRIKVKKIIG